MAGATLGIILAGGLVGVTKLDNMAAKEETLLRIQSLEQQGYVLIKPSEMMKGIEKCHALRRIPDVLDIDGNMLAKCMLPKEYRNRYGIDLDENGQDSRLSRIKLQLR